MKSKNFVLYLKVPEMYLFVKREREREFCSVSESA